MKDVTNAEKEIRKMLEVLHLFKKWWDKESKANHVSWDRFGKSMLAKYSTNARRRRLN